MTCRMLKIIFSVAVPNIDRCRKKLFLKRFIIYKLWWKIRETFILLDECFSYCTRTFREIYFWWEWSGTIVHDNFVLICMLYRVEYFQIRLTSNLRKQLASEQSFLNCKTSPESIGKKSQFSEALGRFTRMKLTQMFM
jgi:hypothetical protein